MARLCRVSGGVNDYIADPDQLVDDETRQCPFCSSRHRLRLHGWYERFLVVAGKGAVRVPVRRLLCAVLGRTVSLLPDFCIPKRQFGLAVFLEFLERLIDGASLRGALSAARGEPSGHSVAQSLVRGFLAGRAAILAYLATCARRVVEPPSRVSPRRRDLARLLAGLTAGGASRHEALCERAAGLHRHSGTALA